MKKVLLLFSFISGLAILHGQNCTPDLIYADSGVGIFPGPFSVDNPDGGISLPACINEPYEFTFTVKVPPTFEYQGFVLDLYSVSIETTGAVPNLPEGLSYSCNPPNCLFTPDDDLGCIAIKGTPTAANAAGNFELIIKDVVIDNNLATLSLDFPNQIIPGASGQYILELREEGACGSSSTDNLIARAVQLDMVPNPVYADAQLLAYSEVEGEFYLYVQDIFGRTVSAQPTALNRGDNTINIDCNQLIDGVYTAVLQNPKGFISTKFVVKK